MNTKQIVLASRPKGMATVDNFRLENIELPGRAYSQCCLQGVC